MASFLNGVRFRPTTAGTDDWTVDEAVQGYQTPVNAGAVDGATYRYRAESRDLLEWEIGDTVYTAATQGFTRTVRHSSNANTKVNFTRVPDVGLIALAEDISPLGDFSESVDDRVAALVQDGTNLTWAYDDGAGTLTGNVTRAALTRINDTNVTLTLGGAPTTALLTATSITVGWSGQLALSRGGTNADLSATGGTAQYLKQSSAGAAITVGTIPASDIQSGAALTRTDDTNVTLTLGGGHAAALLSATSLTLGWTGTLAAGRLNSNVVQGVTNDTNVTGSISAQNLTLGWTGLLAPSRGGTGISSLGTGVATALGINVGSAGAFVTYNGAGGTPSSITLTNGTGLPLSTGVTGDLPFANLTQIAGLSVLGVSGNSTADVAAITAASDHQVMRRSGNAIAFGAVNLASSNAVTGVLPAANFATGTPDGTKFLRDDQVWAVPSGGGSSFPAGTLMLFQQTSAPTGWTKETTHNDKALRVVSGTASSGGTSAFSTVFGKTATDATTISTTTMPAHTHGVGRIAGPAGAGWTWAYEPGSTFQTGSTGSGSSHTHGMDIRVQYVDIIIASKD